MTPARFCLASGAKPISAPSHPRATRYDMGPRQLFSGRKLLLQCSNQAAVRNALAGTMSRKSAFHSPCEGAVS